MQYPTASAFRRALEDRLNQRARTTGEPVMRLRKNVVFQRAARPAARRLAGSLDPEGRPGPRLPPVRP
jgi:hypothetical protein